MLDVTKVLEELKAQPYEEILIAAPHTGVVAFEDLKLGDTVAGPSGVYKEKPGAPLAFIERERNRKPIRAPQKGEIVTLNTELAGAFVEAGAPLARIRHFLSKEEALGLMLKKLLHLFPAPERAKYYFPPETDLKIKASGAQSVTVRPGMELCIMSRMKREAPVIYDGPEGAIYAVYFKAADNVDAGEPLIGVCPPSQLQEIAEVVARVQTEWRER